MKTPGRLPWVLLAIFVLAAAPVPAAAESSGGRPGLQIPVVIVAERFGPGATVPLPTPENPVSFVAVRGGFIQEGDGNTREEPADAPVIARELRRVLGSQHYLPAGAQAAPSLVVICHWGLVGRNAHQTRLLSGIDSNLKARLALVATAQQAGEIENFLLSRLQGRTNPAYPIPINLSLPARGILDRTRNARWFVVVSAYDFPALVRHEHRLVQRVKMSTDQRPDLTLAEVLPALLQAGGPYFGRNLVAPKILSVPLVAAEAGAVAPPSSAESPPAPGGEQRIDRADLRSLVQQERTDFSWIRAAQFPADDDGPPP